MKRFLFFVLILFNTVLLAQLRPADSTVYYQKEFQKVWKEFYDSLRHSERLTTLRSRYVRYLSTSKNYTAFVLYGDVLHSDYRTFNALLQQSGFPTLNPYAGRLGLGVTNKRANAIYDVYFGTIGFNNKVSKGNETVRTSLSNLLQLDFGLDLLNQERVSLYPFGGLSLRFSDISYDKSSNPNPAYTSLANMRTDGNSTHLESTHLGYQYGVGLDLSFGYNAYRTYKTILFVKAGANKPFGTDVYKSDDIPNYKPGIKQGNWLLTVGFKFANKR